MIQIPHRVFPACLAAIVTVGWIAGEAGWMTPAIDPESAFPISSPPIALIVGISGVALALIVPALPWVLALARRPLRAAVVFHRAFAINLIQATAFASVYKAFAGVAPPRAWFVAWQVGVTAVGLALLFRIRQGGGRSVVRRGGTVIPGVLVILVLLPALLWGKTFVENGSGDGTEAFEFSRSLATHQVPHWDLENGYYGFYPQFMLFAYPTHLSFIMLGETEAAQRLPVFFYLLGIYLVLAELVRGGRRRLSSPEVLLLLGAAAFFLLYHAHHSTYELVSDLAEPTGVDTFFTFLATSAFYALITKQRSWWGLYALWGAMALPTGLPFALLFLAGRVTVGPVFRNPTAFRGRALDALAFIGPWLGYQILVTVYSRFHPLGSTKWELSNLLETYSVRLEPLDAVTLVMRFVLVTAALPVAGLWPFVRRDRIAGVLRFAILGYLALLFLFGRTHPHYLIPLSLFPAALFMRALAWRGIGSRARVAGRVSYGMVLLALTVASMPTVPEPHTAYRRFGDRTLMLYDSYPAVVDAAAGLLERRPELYLYLPDGKPLFAWERPRDVVAGRPGESSATGVPLGLSHHLWIRYSHRTPHDGREYDQVLAAADLAPARLEGFARRDLADGWVLFYRPGSIFAQAAPLDR